MSKLPKDTKIRIQFEGDTLFVLTAATKVRVVPKEPDTSNKSGLGNG